MVRYVSTRTSSRPCEPISLVMVSGDGLKALYSWISAYVIRCMDDARTNNLVSKRAARHPYPKDSEIGYIFN